MFFGLRNRRQRAALVGKGAAGFSICADPENGKQTCACVETRKMVSKCDNEDFKCEMAEETFSPVRIVVSIDI